MALGRRTGAIADPTDEELATIYGAFDSFLTAKGRGGKQVPLHIPTEDENGHPHPMCDLPNQRTHDATWREWDRESWPLSWLLPGENGGEPEKPFCLYCIEWWREHE